MAIQRHWVTCLRTGQTPETSGEDNLRTLELVESAYISAASGATIGTQSASLMIRAALVAAPVEL